MNQELTIKVTGTQPFMGMEIPVVLGGFGPEARCICDKTAAEIHGTDAIKIRERINSNIGRFSKGIDYVDMAQRIRAADTLEILHSLGYSKQAITQAEHIYILSERGYFKLVKILNSDQAWDVYENLLTFDMGSAKVRCTCPGCGAEVIADADDLYERLVLTEDNESAYCPSCSKKLQAERSAELKKMEEES